MAGANPRKRFEVEKQNRPAAKSAAAMVGIGRIVDMVRIASANLGGIWLAVEVFGLEFKWAFAVALFVQLAHMELQIDEVKKK